MWENRYRVYLLIFIVALLASCSTEQEEIIRGVEVVPEDTPIEVLFAGYTGEMEGGNIKTRVNSSSSIQNLRLLVFNENGDFLYSRKAVLAGETDAPNEDRAYLPDEKKESIEKIKLFSVQLLSSTKKRYIHFIANYDWADYPQDYFLEGRSQGQIIPQLTTTKTSVFWQQVEVNGIHENSFNGKVIKMLRNAAKIHVNYIGNVSDFSFEGFTIYNCYDRGTVAPYFFNNQDLSFYFPQKPTEPTIPSDVKLMKRPDFAFYPEGVDVFEHSNTENQSLFILIKGRYKNKRTGFYKIDLTEFHTELATTSLHSLIRNHLLNIDIKMVLNEGYETEEMAVNSPAGNNIFSSIEMEGFPTVSNGKETFSVGVVEAVLVKAPVKFSSKVFYSAGMKNVKLYGDWEDDHHAQYVKDLSFNIPDSTSNEGEVVLEFKEIPKDETLKFRLKLVAQPHKGMTSSIITRDINVYIRPPYDFNAKIETYGLYAAGSRATISFDVPSTLSESLFPFDVYIHTKHLTPVAGQGMSLITGHRTYFVKYTVQKPQRGQKVTLEFSRNLSYTMENITLISDYFDQEIVLLK